MSGTVGEARGNPPTAAKGAETMMIREAIYKEVKGMALRMQDKDQKTTEIESQNPGVRREINDLRKKLGTYEEDPPSETAMKFLN